MLLFIMFFHFCFPQGHFYLFRMYIPEIFINFAAVNDCIS